MILSKDKRHKGCGFDLWVGKIPLEKGDNLFQHSCLKNRHGQRRLAGYSPWGGRVGHD